MISIFNPDTGEITQCVSQPGDNANWIIGYWPNNQYHVVNGQAVPLPPKPDQDSTTRFNHVTQQWQVNTDVQIRKQRNRRNILLSQVDRVNPLWYASLTAEQQQQLAQYRLDLLAVPQQTDFPVNIIWPAKPTWL
jgi:hypothetical protein